MIKNPQLFDLEDYGTLYRVRDEWLTTISVEKNVCRGKRFSVFLGIWDGSQVTKETEIFASWDWLSVQSATESHRGEWMTPMEFVAWKKTAREETPGETPGRISGNLKGA